MSETRKPSVVSPKKYCVKWVNGWLRGAHTLVPVTWVLATRVRKLNVRSRLVRMKGERKCSSSCLNQRTFTYFVTGSITVRLTSCFICLVSAALLLLNEEHIYLFGQIQAGQTASRPYSDTSPYKVLPHLISYLYNPIRSCCIGTHSHRFIGVINL